MRMVMNCPQITMLHQHDIAITLFVFFRWIILYNILIFRIIPCIKMRNIIPCQIVQEKPISAKILMQLPALIPGELGIVNINHFIPKTRPGYGSRRHTSLCQKHQFKVINLKITHGFRIGL